MSTFIYFVNLYLIIDIRPTLIGMNTVQGGSTSRPAPPLPPEVGQWAVSRAQALAQAFSGLAGDVTLVIDGSGVILGACLGEAAGGAERASRLRGQAWVNAVDTDSRGKVALMLQELAGDGEARRREINFGEGGAAALVLACSALRLGDEGPALVVGRDLHACAQLQQRLVEVQQQLERTYWDARRRLVSHDEG